MLFLVSNVGYLVAKDFWGFMFVFGTLSFGHTFVSGSGSAWLYDTLTEHDIEDEFTRISGRAGAISSWVMAATMIAGGLLYVTNTFYPFIAAIAFSVVNVVFCAFLPKNAAYSSDPDRRRSAGAGDEDDDRITILDALPVIRERLAAHELRSFIVYMALFSGAIMTADMYIQPVVRDALAQTYGALLSAWGVPEAATLGFLYASFMVVGAITSDYAADVEEWLGVKRAMFLLPMGIAVLYLLPVFVPLVVFPMFVVMKGATSLIFPISGRYVNDQIESVGRATVLSAVSMVRSVAGIPFRIGSGMFADAFTPVAAVAVLGAIFVVGALLLHAYSPPVKESPPGAGTTPTVD